MGQWSKFVFAKVNEINKSETSYIRLLNLI